MRLFRGDRKRLLSIAAPLALLLACCASATAETSSNASSSNANPPIRRAFAQSSQLPYSSSSGARFGLSNLALQLDERPPECPPCPEPSCFNCQLPKFTCQNFGECNEYDGACTCPTGFGGQDCLAPLCGSPADGSRRRPRPDGAEECECAPGWAGLNCNVCQADVACADFTLGGDRLGENGTCYAGGQTIRKSFQQCDVTNSKITDMLPGRPPQVTFSCDKESSECNFQFWIGHRESFFCGLQECSESSTITADTNTTRYECGKVQCSCIPDRMLCGEDGSIDISEFLSEEIKGPGKMICRAKRDPKTGQPTRDCRFEEPAMNQLISDVFGDEAIFLRCDSGECVHYSEVPGYQAPAAPERPIFWVAFSAAGAVLFVVLISALLYFLGRDDPYDRATAAALNGSGAGVRLPEEENESLMRSHVPATLHFDNISYKLGDKLILQNVSGSVRPGQVMAIMGASGAGKSTFLDILARRNKRGLVSGRTLVNGREIGDAEFKRVVGYVDQEETLMSTLTVYETVLYSALLRLPREMSLEAKKLRTLETLEELGILHIKDSRIGSADQRGISGGERRRTAIACELCTQPSILMLDEVTTGLDAYNAYNVVDSLIRLARDYRRTVIFTIHQPRSNIVALFDQLVLLAAGRPVYSGPFDRCVGYFEQIGRPCPIGFNVADYLIDISAEKNEKSLGAGQTSSPADQDDAAEQALLSSRTTSSAAQTPREQQEVEEGEEETELRTRPNSYAESGSARSRRQRISQGLRSAFSRGDNGPARVPDHLVSLFDDYLASDIAADLRAEIDAAAGSAANGGSRSSPEAEEAGKLKGYKKAGLWTQFKILSGRAFKNLYRNPLLMLAHYAMAAFLALFCGLLYHGLTLDISGFQDRLGVMFFVLALFGFSCLTSLGVFASERALFVQERANGYYSPVTYFISKLLFDILPLRVVPPFIFGSIAYFLIGLIPEVTAFWKFILVLVLFSLAASAAVFFISIAIKDTGVANLVGSLTMLFSLLFAGLLINRDRIPLSLRWLQHLSFFHAAYEAMIVNELRNLSLKEHKYGIDIDVPAASIISSFGFNSQAFWWPDIATLGIQFGGFTILSLLWLLIFVRERK